MGLSEESEVQKELAGGRGDRQGLLAHAGTWDGSPVLADSVLLCCLKAQGESISSLPLTAPP